MIIFFNLTEYFRLQNELKFKPRAEKILKHLQQHDLIIIEEKNVNKLQQSIQTINDDLNNDIDKESKYNCIYTYIHAFFMLS